MGDAVRISEPQVVARAGASGRVVGICIGPEASQVTCTLVPHGVQVVDVTSSTCVLSWSLKGRSPLLPAAVVGAGERLVLACDDGSVLSWRTKETTDLSKADALKGGKGGKGKGAILSMLLVEPSLEAVLLIHNDGLVRMMSADLSHELCSTQLGLPKDSTAVFADLARAGSNSYLAVLLVREADGGTSVGRWRVNGEGGSFSMTKVRWDTLQYPSSGAKGEKKTGDLLTCALHCPPPESTMQPSLSVVWDSLVWQRFRVGTGSSPTLETTFHVHGAAPMPRAARSKGGAPPGAKGVVATTIRGDYLLIVGRSEGGESASGGRPASAGANCVQGWDSLYGTKQGLRHLHWSADEADLAQYAADAATAARSSRDGSFVAVALDKCVVACGMQSETMTLEKVVVASGKARSSAQAQPAACMRPVDVLACIEMAVGGGEHEAGAGDAEIVEIEGLRSRVAEAVQEGNRRESALLSQIVAEGGGSKWVEAVKLYLEDLQAESANTEV